MYFNHTIHTYFYNEATDWQGFKGHDFKGQGRTKHFPKKHLIGCAIRGSASLAKMRSKGQGHNQIMDASAFLHPWIWSEWMKWLNKLSCIYQVVAFSNLWSQTETSDIWFRIYRVGKKVSPYWSINKSLHT